MSLDLLTRTIAVSILASSLVVIVVMATRYTPSSARVSNGKGDCSCGPECRRAQAVQGARLRCGQ